MDYEGIAGDIGTQVGELKTGITTLQGNFTDEMLVTTGGGAAGKKGCFDTYSTSAETVKTDMDEAKTEMDKAKNFNDFDTSTINPFRGTK